MGDPGGAAAPDDDEVGEFSDEELVDLPEGDDDDEPIVIDIVAPQDTYNLDEVPNSLSEKGGL